MTTHHEGSSWFKDSPEKWTLARNPFKLRYSKLVIGDIVTVERTGDPGKPIVYKTFLVLGNRKSKVSYLWIQDNLKSEKKYLDFEYLYCMMICREGQECKNLLDLQAAAG